MRFVVDFNIFLLYNEVKLKNQVLNTQKCGFGLSGKTPLNGVRIKKYFILARNIIKIKIKGDCYSENIKYR